MISSQKAYFIKLGRNGSWEKRCIEEGILRLGFNNPYHQDCLLKKYENCGKWFSENGKTKGVVTSIVNQIKTFYEADNKILWITFYNRKLWYCTTSSGVEEIDDGSRIRKTTSGWSSTDIKGTELSVDRLSGKLTKVQMFQGTICEVKEYKYLHEKINCILSIEIQNTKKCLDDLKKALIELVRLLTWKDFELLVDLIFSDAGWKRLGVIGKTEKDIDLDLLMPVTEIRAFVQIKASSNQNEFDDYYNSFEENDLFQEMYYVIHTESTPIYVSPEKKNVHLIKIDKIVDLIISAGLVNWVLEKVA